MRLSTSTSSGAPHQCLALSLARELTVPPPAFSWVYLWAAIMHVIFAVFSGCNFLKYVTKFPCETFGFYVRCVAALFNPRWLTSSPIWPCTLFSSWVYIQYGIQVLTRQFGLPTPSVYLSILLAVLTLVVGHLLTIVSTLPYFHRHVRRFIADYGMPIAVIACSGLAYWGRFHESINVEDSRLPIEAAYTAANGRAWIVPFWELSGKWVGIAFPFGFVLFVVRPCRLARIGDDTAN